MVKAKILVLLVLLVSILPTQSSIGFTEEGWNTFDLPEIGLNLSVPSDFDIFTRNMPEDSPILEKYGLTADQINSDFISRGAYLGAYAHDGTKEINVTMRETHVADLRIFEDDIQRLMPGIITGFKDAGTIIDKYDVYRNDAVTFIAMWHHAASDPSITGLSYFTMYNSQGITILLQSYTGEVNEADEKLMQDIAQRAIFYSISGSPIVDDAETN